MPNVIQHNCFLYHVVSFKIWGKPQDYCWNLDSKDTWRTATLRVGRLDQDE